MDPLETIAAVRRACVSADGHDPLDEAADLRLRHHGLAGIEHHVATEGFALVRDGEIDLAVAPPARRRGLGGRLLDRALAERGVAGGRLTAWSHGDHPAAAALARRTGFQRVRDLWVMRRAMTAPLPEPPEPAGVTVRGYAGASDDDALLAVNAAAFAQHPEQGALDRAGLAERMAEPWFDPEGLLVAVDETAAILGFHWTKQHSATLGEVYVVGISPDAQGRGLGRLLTLAGLHHLARRGVTETHLYVESDNAPAVALYGGLGFTHARGDSHVQYVRDRGHRRAPSA